MQFSLLKRRIILDNDKEKKVLELLTPIFRSVFNEPSLILSRNITAKDVDNWDSLNHIILIVQIEEMTNLSFSTNQLVKLNNVGDFVDLILELGFTGNVQPD
jgi:acyl carrier protein